MIFVMIGIVAVMQLFKRKDAKSVKSPRTPTPPVVNGLSRLSDVVASGSGVEDWHIDDAIADAYASGDFELALHLSDIFNDDDEGGDGECEAMESLDDAFEKQSSSHPTPSPIKGLDDESWSLYVRALKGHEADDGGWFHLNPSRVAGLGFTELGDYENQLRILEADTLDNLRRGEDFLNASVGETVSIDGVDYVASLSGLLAVLKAAGNKNAGKWFKSDGDKDAFPSTTGLFVKANGCF